MPNCRADKTVDDWTIAMYCDYGKTGTKRLIRASYSLASALNSWNKLHKYYSQNGYHCWQEDKTGKIVRKSSNTKA